MMRRCHNPLSDCPQVSKVEGVAWCHQYLCWSSPWQQRPTHLISAADSLRLLDARHGFMCGCCWWVSAQARGPSRALSPSPSKSRATSPWAACSQCTLGDLPGCPAGRSREKRGSIDWRPCCMPWIRSTATRICCLTSPWGPGSWTLAPGIPTPWSSRLPSSRPSSRRTTQTYAARTESLPSSPNQRGWSGWSGRLAALCPSWWPMCSDCLQ